MTPLFKSLLDSKSFISSFNCELELLFVGWKRKFLKPIFIREWYHTTFPVYPNGEYEYLHLLFSLLKAQRSSRIREALRVLFQILIIYCTGGLDSQCFGICRVFLQFFHKPDHQNSFACSQTHHSFSAAQIFLVCFYFTESTQRNKGSVPQIRGVIFSCWGEIELLVTFLIGVILCSVDHTVIR